MADSNVDTISQTPAIDTTQQVTSQTPATKPKNPKRFAAGKAVAERTRIACEAQEKAYIDAQIAKQASPPPVSSAGPPPVSSADPPADESTKNVLTTTQWLSAISIVVSLAGIYYKREEIKGLLTKKKPSSDSTAAPPNTPVDCVPRRGIQPMD